ncbi:hypothetical protein TNCV_623371 [Trichonephila clavipes]|nr:hypothetical protein TNCV_623371 [Trichonephila clavipes]
MVTRDPKEVSLLWNQFQSSGTVTRLVSQECHRPSIFEQDHYLSLSTRWYRRTTALQLARDLATVSRRSISRKTSAIGMRSWKPIRDFLGAMGPDYIFMDDDAQPHRTHNVDEFIKEWIFTVWTDPREVSVMKRNSVTMAPLKTHSTKENLGTIAATSYSIPLKYLKINRSIKHDILPKENSRRYL